MIFSNILISISSLNYWSFDRVCVKWKLTQLNNPNSNYMIRPCPVKFRTKLTIISNIISIRRETQLYFPTNIISKYPPHKVLKDEIYIYMYFKITIEMGKVTLNIIMTSQSKNKK